MCARGLEQQSSDDITIFENAAAAGIDAIGRAAGEVLPDAVAWAEDEPGDPIVWTFCSSGVLRCSKSFNCFFIENLANVSTMLISASIIYLLDIDRASTI